MLLGDQALPATNPLVSWSVTGLFSVLSLAPFITSRGFLQLEKGCCAKACGGLVRNAKGQASRGVDAGVTEVKAWAAAAAKT